MRGCRAIFQTTDELILEHITWASMRGKEYKAKIKKCKWEGCITLLNQNTISKHLKYCYIHQAKMNIIHQEKWLAGVGNKSYTKKADRPSITDNP